MGREREAWLCVSSDPVHPQSVETAVLLPEEPAPALGVKNSGLHFLTAGDQGVGRLATRGPGSWVKPVDLIPPTALVLIQGSSVCGRPLRGSVCTPSHKCQARGRN